MKLIRNYRPALALLLALLLAFSLAACGKQSSQESAAETDTQEAAASEDDTQAADAQDTAEEDAADAADSASGETTDETAAEEELTSDVLVHIGSLKGPTTMGLVQLMNAAEEGQSKGSYSFTMAAQPTEIASEIANGNLDIALVPANLAATLYNRTEGGVIALNINTLGVLYCVTGDESVTSVSDLAGRTILSTGQGATPEYAIRYLMAQYGVDAEIDFRSEATEVAAVLNEDASQVAILPQPFATVAQVQNESVHAAFSLSDEWDALNNGSSLVTGVTIVRKAFLEEHPEAVALFLQEQAASADAALANVEQTAELVAKYGIIEKAPIAQKALPYCGIACVTSEDGLQTILSGYLQTLFDADASSIGGALPAEDFYYAP